MLFCPVSNRLIRDNAFEVAWGCLPLLVGAYGAGVMDQPTGWKVLLTLFVPSFAMVVVYWFHCLRKDEPARPYTITKKLVIPLIAGPPLVTRTLFVSAYAPTCFVLSAWFLANSLVHAIKITSRRARPVVALEQQLKKVHRELDGIRRVAARGESGFHSFPSGDSCGAAVYSTTLYLLGARNPLVFATPVVLSSYGRVYFHCHHLSDVLVGDLIGMMVTLWLNNRIGMYTFSALHSTFFGIFFIAFIIVVRLLFKFKVPEGHQEEGLFSPKKE